MAEPVCMFIEVEPWERQRIIDRCAECVEIEVREETLQELPSGEHRGVRVLSPFIHSRVDRAALGRFPDLELVATRSTGTDHIDLEACRDLGVIVTNVPTYGANTVAEHTFALILALTRQVHKAYEQTVRGRFSIEGLKGLDLRGRTIGVVGTGAIGTHVIRIALGFQMRVLAYDPRPIQQMADALGFEYVDLQTLLRESHVVTLHAPDTPQTHHMIGAAELDVVRSGAILVNTARGGLVDTEALITALRQKKLAGAGLDVLEHEQVIMEEGEMLSRRYDEQALQSLVRNTILLRMDNVIMTPHIAFNSEEALDKILDTTAANILAFVGGHAPPNLVLGRAP